MANHRLLWLRVALFTALFVQPVMAQQSALTAVVNITFATEPQLGKTTVATITATSNNNSAQVTLEHTNPLSSTHTIYGLWSGIGGTGGFSQESTLSFTQAGPQSIYGVLKLEFSGQTTYSNFQEDFTVLPEEQVAPQWSISAGHCPTTALASSNYVCNLTVTVGLIVTFPGTEILMRTYVDNHLTAEQPFPFEDMTENGTVSITSTIEPLTTGNHTVKYTVEQRTGNNDAYPVATAEVIVTVADIGEPPRPDFRLHLPLLHR